MDSVDAGASGVRLFRAHGLGNDYLAADLDGLPFGLSPPTVRLICDRHRGAGSDGILARVASGTADFGLRIFNPDGTEAEKSGNGLRIFATYLHSLGQVTIGGRFTVETPGGTVQMEILEYDAAGGWMVEVEMGRASFRSADVGLAGDDRDTGREMLELPSGERVDCTLVSLGNPHCVVFQDELDVERLRRIAPLISTHPWFRRGTNVQFARGDTPSSVEAWVWERGAGETLASGSSACAVAAVAVRRGLVSERQVDVRMPGGVLGVEVRDDWSVLLRGPVEDVGWIELSKGMAARCAQMVSGVDG
jgi:diaminopimelate epimerase